MSIIAKGSSEQLDRKVIPEGVHVAKCYAIYDIGTQKKIWKDKVKFVRKVVLAFEVPEERILIEKDGEEKDLPMAISSIYTLSIFPKAYLRKDLETWRGKTFTKEELDGFDLKNITGKSCLIQVVHEPKEDGSGVWVNIQAIMSLPKGQKHEGTENPIVVWSITNEDGTINDDFSCVPDWIKTKACACIEVLESESKEEEEVPYGADLKEPEATLPF